MRRIKSFPFNAIPHLLKNHIKKTFATESSESVSIRKRPAIRHFHKKTHVRQPRQDMRIFSASAKYHGYIPPTEYTLASISPSLVSQAMNLIISRLSGSRIIVRFRLPGFSPVTCQEVPMHSALSSETAISAFPMETNSPITAAGQRRSFTCFSIKRSAHPIGKI